MIPLNEGGYRMYWDNGMGAMSGIGSATSPDGINFTIDEGIRLAEVEENSECIASHVWLTAEEEGY